MVAVIQWLPSLAAHSNHPTALSSGWFGVGLRTLARLKGSSGCFDGRQRTEQRENRRWTIVQASCELLILWGAIPLLPFYCWSMSGSQKDRLQSGIWSFVFRLEYCLVLAEADETVFERVCSFKNMIS